MHTPRLQACTGWAALRPTQLESVADRAVRPGMQFTWLSSLSWRGYRAGCPEARHGCMPQLLTRVLLSLCAQAARARGQAQPGQVRRKRNREGGGEGGGRPGGWRGTAGWSPSCPETRFSLLKKWEKKVYDVHDNSGKSRTNLTSLGTVYISTVKVLLLYLK